MKLHSFGGNLINDGADYVGGFVSSPRGLPAVQVHRAGRSSNWPLLAGISRPGRTLLIEIIIVGAARETLRTQLHQWFDPEDETPKALYADINPSTRVYVDAICEELREAPESGGSVYLARLAVHGDVRWRRIADAGSGGTLQAAFPLTFTRTIDPGGEDLAFPRLEITPNSAKTNDYVWKRWIPIRWRVDTAHIKYPVDVVSGALDTAALVTAGKMQADGDDLRVFVNGAEVNRWLSGMNTAATKVWANLSFQARQEALLTAAIAGTGTVDTIDVGADISGFPSSGIVMVDNEAFLYSAKNNQLRRFTGVTRAQRGTTMAAHSAGATVWWVQHDIFIVYGNAAAGAPATPIVESPMFQLTSTNTSWVYADFGDAKGTRPGSWKFHSSAEEVEAYGGNRGAAADPWAEVGVRATKTTLLWPRGSRYLYNPCGITNLNFTNGEKRLNSSLTGPNNLLSWWRGRIVSRSISNAKWLVAFDIAAPSALDTWETWSRSQAISPAAVQAGLELEVASSNDEQTGYLEAADCTVTLDSTKTPTTTIGAEQGNYQLALTIHNETRDEAIRLLFNMAVGETLYVDTEQKLITYSLDGASYFGALEMLGGPRRHWLPLAPGDNTVNFADPGTNSLTVQFWWRRRFYG